MSRVAQTLLMATVLGMTRWAGLASANIVEFRDEPGVLKILIDGETVASYVCKNNPIGRPYFHDVRTRGGITVTRPYPPDPVANKDNDDHANLHPGLWLAFGDVSGYDYWRNKVPVRHSRYVRAPEGGEGIGRFSVINVYCKDTVSAEPVFTETCEYTIRTTPSGYCIVSQSMFTPAGDSQTISFGDQEEMGLGVRIDTRFTVKFGNGSIVNSEGGTNESGTWGKAADWCAYVGEQDGRRVGVMMIPSPGNFRKSWFHTRDYGLMVANPFAEKAMTAPDDNAVSPDSTEVKRGESLSLGFCVLVLDEAAEIPFDGSRAFAECVNMMDKKSE
ncbi:MAG: hypothetical protein AMXMBFR84_32380 [Candidatus Hydrogenedentota bacterium]